jgi:hypothetical protein
MKFPIFPEAEGAAVKRAVENCGREANAVLFQKLARKAQFYGVTGFVIAAHILRAWRLVERRPADHPQSDAWIVTVVENALAAASGMRSGEPKSPGSVGQREPMKEQSGGGSPERVPLAAAAGQGGESRTPADLPGTPPTQPGDTQAPTARTETSQDAPRKLPETSRGIRDQIERLAARKTLGRQRGP